MPPYLGVLNVLISSGLKGFTRVLGKSYFDGTVYLIERRVKRQNRKPRVKLEPTGMSLRQKTLDHHAFAMYSIKQVS